MRAGRVRWAALCVAAAALAGCSGQHAPATPGQPVAQAAPDSATPSPTPAASPSHPAKPSASLSRKPSPKPTRTLKKTVSAGGDIPRTSSSAPVNDGVPTKGAGTFAVDPGSTEILGTGTTLVKYRIELENGIAWGANPVWTPASFAATVHTVLSDPRSWIRSAEFPVTDAAEGMTNQSWSFQQVSGSDYTVRIRLATPTTVDKLCGSVGLSTQGQYSCRYGSTILINLRRWLKGAPGFDISLTGYRNMVINHEMGHLLGFDHMLCPGAGQPAPVMQTQTISLGGCVPNAFPFATDGTFILGPWASS
jgi:hypothetical protein